MENKQDKKESPIKAFFKKMKKIKGIEIAIVVVLVGVMLLIAFSSFKKTTSTSGETEATTLEEYGRNLENKLGEVLSKISGAGDVYCMISFETGFRQQLAYLDDSSKTEGSNGSSTSSNVTNTQNVVYTTVNGKEVPLVLYEENPKIAGVIVVSSGANSVNVKLDIIRAVSTLLNLEVSCIEVLTGK